MKEKQLGAEIAEVFKNTHRFPLPTQRSIARSLRPRESAWRYYNSPLDNYSYDFRNVLKGEKIENLLSGVENPVVIDLMTSSGTLADLFGRLPQSTKMGIAVSLGDLRDEETKARDSKLGIVQITGDLTSSSTWKKIVEATNGRKADLVMERGLGSLTELPRHPIFYWSVFQRMWNLLGEQGVLLLQIPAPRTLDTSGISIRDVRRIVREASAEYRFSLTGIAQSNMNIAYIRRRPSSPDMLPFTSNSINPASFFARSRAATPQRLKAASA